MLMVLATIAFWYVGDALYNDYSLYLMEFDPNSLLHAWWEVFGFICAFGYLAPKVHRAFNKKYLGRPSNLLSLMFYGGLKSDKFQDQLDIISQFLVVMWTALMVVGLFRTDFDFLGMFMPYLGEKADPWAHARLGGGFDAIWAAVGYFQVAMAATFGVILALSYRRSTFIVALVIEVLTLPGYIFDRIRSLMLATLLPGFLAFVFLRMRSNIFVKAMILVVGFLVMESWLKFVIENRDGVSIAEAFHNGMDSQIDKTRNMKHLGLNMFEELGYINLYISDGSYRPNWGRRYLDELTNPIPRTLWPGKPMIGIDYAMARGQKIDNDSADATGVGATVSTGMIGQGVVNFGRILGPIAAALIMSCWVAILARQDVLAADPWRLFLYVIGLILTFNMGRDVTLLVIYPFCFFYLLLLAAKGWHRWQTDRVASKRQIQTDSPESSGI